MKIASCIGLSLLVFCATAFAQQHPEPRYHRANEAKKLELRSATQEPIAENRISVSVQGNQRLIKANSIARHKTGRFPGQGNPNFISEQSITFALPLTPEKNSRPRYYQLGTFGIGVNGVLFEPQAAEWYHGVRGSEWQYDALGGALALGFDTHHAHVQPNGTYHYHGLPTGLMNKLSVRSDRHSPLIGWAMDGFPVYALFGEDESGKIREMKSSYRLKKGTRPSGGNSPGGSFDGAFVADWEYVPGAGDLDECNGRSVKTREFPNGTYAYFLTGNFPVIPRCFYGFAIAEAFGPGGRNGRQDSRASREQRLERAARELGISAGTLRRALGPPPPDFRRAAQSLGVSEEKLKRLLRP